MSTRILLLDNHKDHRDSLDILLTLWGNDVRTPADAEGVVHEMMTWQPQIVILCLGEPPSDSFRLAQQVRCLSNDILLFAVSEYDVWDKYSQAISESFNYHIIKPIRPHQLRQLLSEPTKAL